MRILILGGSVFLGRAFVTEALARGHQVTTFNRGRSGPDLPGTEAVRGDRDSDQDLAALVARAPGAERSWDLVIDTSGQQPHTVARAARALRGHAGRYLFVSSVHAFADWPAAPVDEDSPLHDCPADSPPDLPFSTGLKAGCERAVAEQFGERSIMLNCGLLNGPYENVGRLPWWLERIARGGRVLAPGRPDLPIQLIDARDFAVFGLDLAERGASGSYLTTALPGSSSYGEMLAACVAATGSDAELHWVDDDRLRAAGVEEWTELPLWYAEFGEDGRPAGIWQADSRKARAAGLRCRPLSETVRDTWAWIQQRGPREGPYTQGGVPLGIDPEKERRILAGEL
ncbi:NAD-dependent epimerase/dehydratase family protein [Kitasatospora sp. NBC_01266]|uniref:NAD-dependent epimerase/dehydratase family protein n=1 Tax=Kitasatospora sp. NBC_01266 TaxID=2903572 RepID=UPI002E31DCCB|nr:NAD-dependent epimerase/dehydratase family protein [Kitasatospora sp. NBC_01266]